MKVTRIVARIVLIALLLMTLTVAYAAANNPGVSPLYTYTYSIAGKLSISGGTAPAAGTVTPSDLNNKTTVTVKLQRNENGTWKTIATWTGSNSHGISSAGGDKTLTKGYSYRVYVVGKVYNSSGTLLETTTKTTSTKAY